MIPKPPSLRRRATTQPRAVPVPQTILTSNTSTCFTAITARLKANKNRARKPQPRPRPYRRRKRKRGRALKRSQQNPLQPELQTPQLLQLQAKPQRRFHLSHLPHRLQTPHRLLLRHLRRRLQQHLRQRHLPQLTPIPVLRRRQLHSLFQIFLSPATHRRPNQLKLHDLRNFIFSSIWKRTSLS